LTRLGIVAALPVEARALRAAMRTRVDGSAEPLIRVSGMGPVAAAQAARQLMADGATRLMTFGLAAGLDELLRVGAVVVPREVISAQARYETDEACSERIAAVLEALLPQGALVCDGAVFSGPHAIATAADKAAAFEATGAVAADMESAAVAAIAAESSLSFVVLRVIVDTAEMSLPPAVVAASGGGDMRIGRLLAGLAASPAQIAPVYRLSQRYNEAVRVMRAVAPAAVRA
jgi:nucleoside phosphorylase